MTPFRWLLCVVALVLVAGCTNSPAPLVDVRAAQAGTGRDSWHIEFLEAKCPALAGLVEPPDCIVSADGSATFWDFGKAVHQALRADPNTLEMLFVESVRAQDPIGEWLLAARDGFVSREIFGSFGRYAMSQLTKLSHSAKLAEHRGLLLDWLKEEPPPDLDLVATRLADISPRKAPTRADQLYAAKDYVKQHE